MVKIKHITYGGHYLGEIIMFAILLLSYNDSDIKDRCMCWNCPAFKIVLLLFCSTQLYHNGIFLTEEPVTDLLKANKNSA